MSTENPLITNDAVVLGLLLLILSVIFYTASIKKPFWQKFYKYVPVILLCYFVPSVFNSAGIISAEASNLYFVASRYLLPASLVLLCMSIDLPGVRRLGKRAVIMFLAGTVGVVLGGPLALVLLSRLDPQVIAGEGSDAIWRGLSTVSGSWIGGGANQTAMKEIFSPSDNLFSAMVAVDVIVANIWMALLLIGVGYQQRLNKWLKADNATVEAVKNKIENYQLSIMRVSTLTDFMVILGIAFVGTAISHLFADAIVPWFEANIEVLKKMYLTSLASRFFWIIVFSTTIGIALSFTRLKSYEGAGAAKVGSVFIYILVATIGMRMNALAIFDSFHLFLVGFVWMFFHASILIITAKIVRAPYFFLAVGSQANIGGAASAPVVASAFSPALAPVGVLLAVLGYALGTYAAIVCTQLMQWVST